MSAWVCQAKNENSEKCEHRSRTRPSRDADHRSDGPRYYLLVAEKPANI